MAGMKSPLGGLVISGRRYPSGSAIPEKYHRQLEPTERRRDPAFGSELGVPNMGRAVVPHVLTFSGLMTGLARTYRYSDEALRHSISNAHMMLNDPMIAGPLLARQHMTALLNWSVESEDEKDPKLKAVANELTNIISRTPRFTEYRRCLLEAIWYGRYGIQNLYGFHSDRDGNRRRVIADWVPISGDKLLFRFDDGSGDYDRNQIGLKVSASMASKDYVAGRRAIEATGEGLAYFLEKWERKLITLHRHYIRDGEFEDPRSGGQVHGVGLRHFLYWIWYQKQEAFAQVAEIVERTGMGFIIYFYPSGNSQAREEVEKISREQAHTNTILMPAEQDDTYRVEQIPPNTSGLQVLLDYIENYLGDLIVRFILGQTLSSKPSATGMNTGVADLQKDSLFHIIRYDAVNLEETLTRELLLPNRDFNFPKYRNVDFFLRISTKVAAPEQELQALQQLWQMGAEIKTADIFDRLDLSLPDEDDQTLFNPQVLAAAKQFKDQLKNPQPPQMGGGMPPGAPPAPGGGMPPGAPPGGGMPPGQGGPPPGPEGAPPEQMDKEEDEEKARLFGPILGDGPARYRKADRDEMLKAIREAVKETDRNPSEAQRESGNYRKGKFRWNTLEIAIETPKGVRRREEYPPMAGNYGYIKLTESEADHDHIDCLFGPDPQSEIVFCIDQVKEDGKTWDEHKFLLAFTNEAEAKQAYLDSYTSGWKCGPITAMTLDQFLGWIEHGDTGKPIEHQPLRYARKVKSSSGQLSMFGMFDAPSSTPQQSPNVGDTVYENGHVYQFNENHRWIGPIEEQPTAPQPPAAPEETPAEVASELAPAVESQTDKEDTDAGRPEDEWQQSGPEGDGTGRDLRGQPDDGGDDSGRDLGADRVKPPEERVVVARGQYTAPADRSLIPEGLQQSLSDHQQEGTAKVIASMNEVGGALLADSTGVGKTREMLAVGQYYLNQGKKVLVVAPMMVIRANWKKGTITGSWLNDSNAMGVPVHLTKDKLDPNAVNLTTYENLSKMKNLVDSDTVLIVEESQYAKNHDSARAKHAVEMSKRAHAVLFATATPIDKVQHLHYLERAGAFGKQWYGKTYEQLGLALEQQRTPNGYIKVWKQKLKSSEVMRRLSGLFDRLTQDGRMIRRELSMDGVPVTSHQLTLPQECHDAMNRIAQDIKSRGLGPGQERSQMLMHQRRQQEPYKVPHAVDMALEAMRDGRQVVIFASRVNESVVGDKDDESAIRSDGTMVLLKKAMLEAGVPESHIAEIHGGIAKDKIPNEMDRFQSSQARVVIATLESGGAGINLDDTRGDAPRTLIMMTAPFSAVDNMQGIGRVWRLKTQSVPHIHFLFGDTEVDEWNSGLIGKKMKTLGASVAGHVGKVDITELDEKDAIDYEPEDPYIWHYPGEGESPQASFSRLDNGDWGLKVEGTAKVGDEVQVTRKDGTKEIKRVSKVLKSAHGSTIVEFEQAGRKSEQFLEQPPEPPAKTLKQFSPEKKSALLKALRMLAGDDLDRAMEKNGIGFNRFDGQLGHFLASMDELSDQQCEIAERLIVKYQRQVGPEVTSVALKHEEQPAKPKREVDASSHPLMKLANWSESKRMATSEGERIVRTARPDNTFWNQWRKDKEGLKKQGIKVDKLDGDWRVTWSHNPNAEKHSRLRSMVLRYVKDHHPEFYARKVKSSAGQMDLFGGGDQHPRAPVGGTTVGGEAFRGGEFIPAAKVAEVAAETGQSKQQVAQEIQKGEDPVFSLQGGVSKASGKPKPLEIESIKGQQQTMWRGLRTDMPGQRDFIEEAEAKEADARRAAAAKNPDHDEVVMSAVQNAIDTIFLEKAVPATEENCMRIAEGSVYEVISANGYEFTPQQIKLAEDEARHMASGDFYMHAQDQAEKKKPKLTFDEFRKQYQSLFSQMMKYKPNEIGSQEFADKMAALADQYPEWAEQVEDEGAPEAKSEWDESTKQSVNGIDVAKGRFGANRNRWGVIGGVSWGSTPEEAVQEHLGYLDRASKQAEKEKIRSSVIEKLKSGDYAPDDIRQVTAYRETQGGTNEVLGLLASAGVKLARAKEVLKKIGPSDTTEDGYPLYDVAKAFESARSEGHLGPQQNSKDEVIPGGLASGVNFDEFDPHELADGMLTEMEHTSDPRYALEIAADHLREFPDGIDGEGYYDRLAEMEGDDAEQYGKGPRHAPKGGIKIGGQQYSGGMWIPNEAMEAATPAELKELSKRTGEPAEDEPESEPEDAPEAEQEPAKPKGKFDGLQQRMEALPDGATVLGWKKQGDQWLGKGQSLNSQEFLDYYKHPVHMHQILGELDNGPQVDLSGGENDNEAGGEDPAASNRGDAVDNDNVIDAEILGDGIVEAEVIDSTQAVQDVTSVARTFGIPLGDINNDRRLRLFLNRTARRLGFDPESVGNNPTRQAAASAKYLNSQIPYLDATTKWAEYYGWRGSSAQELAARAGNAGRFLVKYAEKAGLRTTGGRDDAADLRDALTFLSRSAWASAGKPQASNASSFDDLSKKVIGFGITWMLLNKLVSK